MYYQLGKFAKIIKRSPQTLRNWDAEGKLKPALVKKSGHRYYTEEQIEEALKLDEGISIAYASVTPDKADLLSGKLSFIKKYSLYYTSKIQVFTDIKHPTTIDAPGLQKVIQLLDKRKINHLILYSKEDLGNKELLSFFEEIFESKGIKVIEIKNLKEGE